ncbi:MAG TPA: Cof-type HAD-IIB family hydrolase [Dehalococcoidia bacterium]|nr:Cof-type HAD-IIB family hydrolase [Dehalococcoidia bacterium]
MGYKLLVVDVDGTLVDKDGKISLIDARAIAEAQSRGVQVSLSTGRVIRACRRIIKELSLRGYHMFFDGAVISDPINDHIIYMKTIDERIIKRAVEFTRANKIYLELYTTDKFYAERSNWSDAVHRNYFGVDPVIDDLDNICECHKIVKAELISHSKEEDEQVLMFKKEFDGVLRFSPAHSPAHPDIEFLNIVDPGVSKGEALRFLIEYSGLKKDEVLAIGDGLNDLPLFEAAGTKIAMENAFDELKALADDITYDVENGGVAAAIGKYLLKNG